MSDKELQLWSVPIINCNEKVICQFQCHKAASEEGKVGGRKKFFTKWVGGHRHNSVGQWAPSVSPRLKEVQGVFGQHSQT